jgi:ferredoxin
MKPGEGYAMLTVDNEVCVGTGMCAQLAPSFVEIGNNRKARPKSARVRVEADLIEAVESCPTQALRLSNEDGDPSPTSDSISEGLGD